MGGMPPVVPETTRGVARVMFLVAAEVGGEDSAARQPSRGKPSRREAHEYDVTNVTEGDRSGNIRKVSMPRRDVALRGLMASCDIFGERSMQYGTYASANS
jgi:hypothetical protein